MIKGMILALATFGVVITIAAITHYTSCHVSPNAPMSYTDADALWCYGVTHTRTLNSLLAVVLVVGVGSGLYWMRKG
jgi:hypothetical protein